MVFFVFHFPMHPNDSKPERRDRCGRDLLVVGFTVQSVPITTHVVSSNPVHGEVYSIQHYVIKFVSDL